MALVSSTATSAHRRAPLPEGTVPVGIALLVAGVATFAFFKVGRVALGGDAEFQPISSLWFATFALAPGFFLPLEQELGRALAHRKALRQGGHPVVGRVVRLAIAIVVLVLLALLAFSPLIVSAYFDDNWWMLAAMATAFVAYAPVHVARGICSGSNRFNSYAVVVGSDGVVRIILCVALAVFGVTHTAPYAFSVALSPLAAVVFVAVRGQLKTDPGPPAPWNEVTQNLGWLLVGTVFSAALLNAGPVAAKLLASDDQHELVTQFAYGVLLARIPLFLFQAVQAALLPRLARLAARGDFVEFRSGLRRLLTLVAVIGVVGTLGALLLGAPIVDLVYGADLSGRTMAMLALSSAIYMGAIATSQAVVALHGHAQVAFGWIFAVTAFLVTIWLGGEDLFQRIELALVMSSLAALVSFSISLRWKLRIADPAGVGDVGPLPEMPLET
jgi:O-antigen/teichoic acid export membrane protein